MKKGEKEGGSGGDGERGGKWVRGCLFLSKLNNIKQGDRENS